MIVNGVDTKWSEKCKRLSALGRYVVYRKCKPLCGQCKRITVLKENRFYYLIFSSPSGKHGYVCIRGLGKGKQKGYFNAKHFHSSGVDR